MLGGWKGKSIYRADDIVLRSFDPGFVEAAAGALERRSVMTVSVTEGHVYLELNGTTLSSGIHEHSIGEAIRP